MLAQIIYQKQIIIFKTTEYSFFSSLRTIRHKITGVTLSARLRWTKHTCIHQDRWLSGLCCHHPDNIRQEEESILHNILDP